jgi:hypothetical protein
MTEEIGEFAILAPMKNQPKNTVCLWYEKDAQAAALVGERASFDLSCTFVVSKNNATR